MTLSRRQVRPLGLALSLPLAFALSGCAPSVTLTDAQIPSAAKLGDVMWAQAAVTDPAFKKIGAANYTDADYESFKAVAARLAITTDTAKKKFSKGAAFDNLADELARHAMELDTASGSKNKDGATTALSAIRDTCRSCHKQFR